MRSPPEPLRLRASGPLACFTRPELKAERVSYQVMTPSAARGLLEAILWKPAIRWRVERIKVLSPIRWMAFRRNEVNGRASPPPAKVIGAGGAAPVLLADAGLNQPDFRASERTAQLLTQVAGRAGRGQKPGRVLVQTFNPEAPAISAVVGHDYAQFAAQELAFRQQLGYPPYRRLTKLTYEDSSPSHAEEQARALSQNLRELLALWGLPEDDLIGPAPAFFARLRGRYRWQLLLRHPDPANFLRDAGLPLGWQVDVDPTDVL